MIVSPEQAADSLKEIAQTERRSAQAFGYARSSPHFIFWGVIWMLGYTGSDLLPYPNRLWAVLSVVGVAGSITIGRNQRRHDDPTLDRAASYRFLAGFAVIFLFVFALFAVMRPANPMVAGAVAPLVAAMFYALLGIWRGLRFLIAGAAVAGLTLAGFFHLHEHFLLWMAGVGGSSLVLVGLWLRRA
jgi:hypothetical protein